MTVDILEFCRAEEFLGLDLYPKQEKVLKEFYSSEKDYRELVLLLGKGSGKDLLATCIVAYSVYWLEELPGSPQGYLGLAASDPIDIINVATTADQATTVFLARLKARLENSEYFQSLDMSVRSDRIFFPNKVNAFAMHSRNEAYEGKNVFVGILDEASAFAHTASFGSAQKCYSTLRSSMMSRFPNHGRICTISYPRTSQNDFTADLYFAKKGKPGVLAIKGPTWEYNLAVKQKDLDEDYEYDPIESRLKYECDTTVSSGQFYASELVDYACRKLKPLVHTEEFITELYNKRFVARGLTEEIPRTAYAYMMGIDIGLRGSSMSMAIGHKEGLQTIVDQVINWTPKGGLEVDFKSVHELIKDFASSNQLLEVWMDQFNSAYLEQLLLADKINANKINFNKRYEMYESANTQLKFSHLQMPDYIKSFMKGPQELQPGKISNVNDVSDAVSLLVYKLNDPGKASEAVVKKKKAMVVMGR